MTEPTIEGIVARGLAELDRRGWDRCVVVGDEVGAAQAARARSGARPSAARALVMGHPALDFNAGGRRPSLNPEVRDVLVQIAKNDYRSYVRALSQVTQDAYDEELAERVHEPRLAGADDVLRRGVLRSRRADRPPPRSCAASTSRCSWSSTPAA